MIKLPAGLDFQQFPRVAAYAVIAALVTAALFAADGAYRWYRVPGTQVAAQGTDLRSVETPAPTSVEAQAAAPASPAASQVIAETPQPETRKVEERAETESAAPQPPNSMRGSISNPVSGSIANSAAGLVERPVAGPSPRVTVGSDDAAPQQPRPTLSQQPSRQQARKQAARERAAPRRPAQAAAKPPARTVKPAEKPNVYWERDNGSQLGFAPQLRKRTCNPATGQMPMQCYYPREGRERFPAKPLD
jgi:hypothetical protein